MSDSDVPEWIVPGVEVLCYSDGAVGGNLNPARTKIKKVATHSFSVERGREPRFSIAWQDARVGGTWGYRRRVVPVDSDKAREVLAAQRRVNAVDAARVAVDEWLRKRTRKSRLDAIAALEAVDD